MLRIDTHAHVWDQSCHYIADSRYQPKYYFDIDTYLALLQQYGLSKGVLVQPSFLGTDNTYLLASLAKYPNNFRGVVVLDFNATSKEEIDRFHALGVRGIRFNLIGKSTPDFKGTLYQKYFDYCNTLGWHIEIHAIDSQWEEIVAKLSHTKIKIIIDHFGRPKDGEIPSEGLQILATSNLNLYVKISGSYRLADSAFDIKPLVNFWIHSIGVHKLLWGSDTPHTQYEDQITFEQSLQYVKDLGLAEAFNANATEVFFS